MNVMGYFSEVRMSCQFLPHGCFVWAHWMLSWLSRLCLTTISSRLRLSCTVLGLWPPVQRSTYQTGFLISEVCSYLCWCCHELPGFRNSGHAYVCIYTHSSLLGDAQKSSKVISGLYNFLECIYWITVSDTYIYVYETGSYCIPQVDSGLSSSAFCFWLLGFQVFSYLNYI